MFVMCCVRAVCVGVRVLVWVLVCWCVVLCCVGVLCCMLCCVVCCVVCVCVGVCGVCVLGCVLCVARLGTRKTPVCMLKTSPCVGSKRIRMCAFCRHTRRRFERTHGDVLNAHTEERGERKGEAGHRQFCLPKWPTWRFHFPHHTPHTTHTHYVWTWCVFLVLSQLMS